jgi:hypothetical protein
LQTSPARGRGFGIAAILQPKCGDHMGRVYVFAVEAGNFDFRRADGATRYFIFGTIATRDAAAGEALLGLWRELAWNLEDLTWYGPYPPAVIRPARAYGQHTCSRPATCSGTTPSSSTPPVGRL